MTPTFDMLRSKRRLRVTNPENGVLFTVSIRDWQDSVFAIRIHPERLSRTRNPFTTKHRVMARQRIEDWLAELQLA